MKREVRYVVMKFKDIESILTQTEREILFKITAKVNDERMRQGRGCVSCVVVEYDWPEYESVWAMIAKRVDEEAEMRKES